MTFFRKPVSFIPGLTHALPSNIQGGSRVPRSDLCGGRSVMSVSVRRVEDITEALWGTRVSPSTVSDLNKKIYATIEAWRNRPIEGEHPYVYLDGIVLKRSWAGAQRLAVGCDRRE